MSPFILRLKKIDGPSRIVIVVSKKIEKRATKRNRMRRLIRESFRRLAPSGLSVMCIVKENMADYSYKEVETIMKDFFNETRRS